MNFKEFGTGRLGIWLFFATAIPVFTIEFPRLGFSLNSDIEPYQAVINVLSILESLLHAVHVA